jgi:hypothetical protein
LRVKDFIINPSNKTNPEFIRETCPVILRGLVKQSRLLAEGIIFRSEQSGLQNIFPVAIDIIPVILR